MEILESPCELYLKSKNKFPDKDIHLLVSQLLKADPDPKGKNCEFIIDSFLEGHFKLDEDEERVKEDILKFKELFGDRRPLPKKGYRELKVMIREKEEKGTKKTIAKSETKKSKTIFNDCKSFFKNVKQTLPEPYASYTKEQSDGLFDQIQNANPTNNFNNCIWIVEELKKGNIQQNDLPEVKKYLENYFTKSNFPLPNFYPNFPTYSNYQLVKDFMDNKVDLLSISDLGILLIPKTKETSCYYGAQTSWCTAVKDDRNMFDRYSKLGNLYIWFDKVLKDKFQFHFESNQFMDRDDNEISDEKFKQFYQHPITGLLFKEEIGKIKDKDILYKYAKILGELPDPSIELFAENAEDAFLYAKNILKGRFEKGEDAIAKDIYYASLYAHNFGRFEKGEDVISTIPLSSFLYARDVLKGRFKKGEDAIGKESKIAFEYAHDILKGRFEKGEDAIAKNPYFLKKYVKFIKALEGK